MLYGIEKKDLRAHINLYKIKGLNQATVFNFASCTGKFFISLCFAIIIAWVLYTGQFNSLLTGLSIKVEKKMCAQNKNNINLLIYSLKPDSGIKIPV